MFSSFGLGRLGLLQNWGGGAAFSPLDLSPTAWWDPSDLTTLFQDSAGTTPVTADGDVVGLVQDKSGNGNHLLQATTANKPLYKTSAGLHWLDFDGVNDSMSVAINLSGTDKVSAFIGVDKTSAATLCVFEYTENYNTQTGSFYLFINDGVAEWSASARGTAGAGVNQKSFSGQTEPDTAVLTITHDIAGDLSTMRRNGVAATSGTGDKGAGNFANSTLYVGARAGTSAFYTDNIYGLLLMSSIATAGNITDMEAWLSAKTGV